MFSLRRSCEHPSRDRAHASRFLPTLLWPSDRRPAFSFSFAHVEDWVADYFRYFSPRIAGRCCRKGGGVLHPQCACMRMHIRCGCGCGCRR